ncbi:amidase [Corynebacterium comes]|uniref:amidase n=1 Tax=Corynebacterium comes TaxID=2675218 RepID=A0A6B8W158_9CORY|nr:amidase [Corynebacterium comes]QGU05737.1 6-aminohexanoate-cyclic-dimer hydrolase [Corynebacterium comes]
MTTSLRDLAASLRCGEVTAVEQVEELAERLSGLTGTEHGFSHLALEQAHEQAERADMVTTAQRGRLHGLLIPVKDLSNVRGMPTTFGSVHRTRRAEATDTVPQAFLDAGAIIPGKSSAAELGLMIYTEPPGLAAPDNPLWPGHTPAGSSGGAAVLVARGILPAAHASDGGGSIRVPAAACGVVGFKPSAPRLAAQGFITRTLDDTAFLHRLSPEPGRRRIGVLTQPLFAGSPVDDVHLRAVDAAAATLREAGHDVVEVHPYPSAEETFDAFTTIFTAKLVGLPGPAEDLVGWLRAHGRAISSNRLAAADRHADHLGRHLAGYWGVDALLTPMTTTDPPAIGHFALLRPAENFLEQTRWSPWGSLFNMTGHAAVSVPWPVPGRPPVGVHLGSLTLSDAALLSLARELHE